MDIISFPPSDSSSNHVIAIKQSPHDNKHNVREQQIDFADVADDSKLDAEDHSDCGEEHCNENDRTEEEYSLLDNSQEDGEHPDESNHSSYDNTALDTKVYVVTSLEEDDETHVITKVNNDGEQPRRGLFGPPSWKPEQLQLAIEAVKKGYSLTEAGKLYGIPRTTLSNKIHGRKRKRPKSELKESKLADLSPYSYLSNTLSNNTADSHTLKLSSNIENTLAAFISKQTVASHVLTRCAFDLIRFFSNSKTQLTYSDDYMKNWIRYFFLRHPKSRFEVSFLQNDCGQLEEDEKHFVDFVFQKYHLKEKIDVVKTKLFDLVNETYNLNSVDALWWYYFLIKHDTVRSTFIHNLQWPDSILDGTQFQGDMDCSIKVALTNLLLRTNRTISPMQESRLEELRSSSSVDSSNHVYYQKQPRVLSQNKISSRNYLPIRPRTNYSPLPGSRTQEDLSSGNDEMTESLHEASDLTNITSTSVTSKSLKETLAFEGLRAVERKLSSEELQYFQFRFSNPHLEEAYDVWRNLKSACTTGSLKKTL